MYTKISLKGQKKVTKTMRKIIIGLLIFVCLFFIIGEITESVKGETDPDRFFCLDTLSEHSDDVWTVDFSENNEWLASGSYDDTIKIWNTSNWSEITTLTGHSDDVISVDFSENNEWLASGSWDDTIKIWNTSDWSEIKTLTGHPDGITSVDFSENNKWLSSGSGAHNYGEIKIWNTSDWSEIKTLTGHSSNVWNVDFSENNEWLASGSLDNTIKIWNTSNWSEITILTGHSENVYCVDFSENNEWIASGSYDNTIKIWNTNNWSEITTMNGHSSSVRGVDFSENNEWLASVSQDNTIKIWNTNNWSEIKTLNGHFSYVMCVDFSKNNKWLASSSSDKTIKIWGNAPDLNLTSSDITFSKENIISDEKVTIYVKIQNIGLVNTSNVKINFYDNSKLIGSDTINILAGETKTASVEWNITSILGNQTIHIKIDEQNNIIEENETNNNAGINITILPRFVPNIYVKNITKTTNPNQAINYQISVTNNGYKFDTIFLSYSTNKPWQYNLNKTAFLQNPQESANATFTIIPSPDTKAGEIGEITITATSNGNSTRQHSITLKTIVNQIHDISFLSDKNSDSALPGKKIFYNFTILNNGNGFKELNLIFNSSASSNTDNWTIEPKSTQINLNSNKFSTIPISVSPPQNAKAYEQAKIVFDLFSITEDKTISTKIITAKVSKYHEIKIDVENKNLFANPNQEVSTTIFVKNNGNCKESVFLELSIIKSNWEPYLEKYHFEIESEDTENVKLFIRANKESDANEKLKIKIFAKVNGNNLATIDINITVNQTHNVYLSCEKYFANVNLGESTNYTLKIENRGNGDDTINLELSGKNSEWGKLEKSQIKLTQNEIKIVKLIVIVPNNANAEEIAKIKISAYFGDEILDFVETKTTVNQIYDISLEIDENEKSVKLGQNEEYKINVINNGNGNDTIRLEKFGINSNWGWFNGSIISVNSNVSKTIILIVKPPVDAVNDEKAKINIQAISKNGETSNVLTTTTTVILSENKKPKAEFKILCKNKEVEKVRLDELITFNASDSSDEDGEIEKYQWIFDNGEIYYGESFNYAFPENTKIGEHTIILKITDNNGAVVEKEVKIEVLEKEEEGNWGIYLILTVILIIGILVIFMLVKITKSLKYMGEVKTTATPIEQPVVPSIKEMERVKEEQERSGLEMWKPKEEEKTKPPDEPILFTKESREIKEFEELDKKKETPKEEELK